MRKLSVLSFLLSSFLLTSVNDIALAKDTDEPDLWDMCRDSRSVFNATAVLPNIKTPKQLDISAKSIHSEKNGFSIFEDSVLIEKDRFRLSTDRLSYDQKNSIISLPLPSHIESKNITFDSEKGEMNSASEVSSFSNVNFVLQSSHIQGSSPEIKLIADDSTLFSQVNFSSCEPGKEAWIFSADNLELDHNDESGSAHHIVVRLKDVPVFYLPYISFPLGERRRSGILTPEFRFGGSANGDEISLPYYWNIASNQDATFTPVYLQKRGLQLKTNYRYLTESSTGEFDLEYLANDPAYTDLNNIYTKPDRYLTKLTHTSNLSKQLSFNINTKSASDSDYNRDFGQSLEIANLSHLEQSAKLSYRQGNWHSKLLAQYFQTTDSAMIGTDRPYRRQPQLSVNGTEPIIDQGLEFKFAAEWVDFTHTCKTTIDTWCTAKEIGSRTDLYPQFSWPMQGSSWFFTPSIGQRFTAYDLTLEELPVEIEDRNLGIFQLDSGLFFERNLSANYTQTLEPRLYYLNVPTIDQSAIPLFDTSETTFNFAQLFRDNRFNGTDRVADANQLTTALTTRIINDKNGNERFSASIGQIHYFDEREVSLSEPVANTDIQTSLTSDIAAEMVLRDTNWSLRLSALQNTDSHEIDKGSFIYHYQTDNRHIFNLGYRYRRDEVTAANHIDQSNISFKTPLSDHWSALVRWNYSLKDEKDLENLAGVEYNSCCWAFRIISRGHLTLDSANQEIFDRSILFTLVLKGFGSAGKANQELERAILGFHPEY